MRYEPRHACARTGPHRVMSAAVGTGALTIAALTIAPAAANAAVLDAHQLHELHLARMGVQLTSAVSSVSGIAAYAEGFAGPPHYYLYGGEGPYGFDCSGLAQVVYAHFGMSIPRISADQGHYLRWESEAAALPGDLVFYGYGGYSYHTAIYLGNGKVVSALDQAEGIVVTPVNYPGPSYWFGTLR